MSTTTTCVVCNNTNSGMMSIYRHPNNLDEMLQYVTGHQAAANDFLCILCYEELKIAFNFKQKCLKSTFYRPTELNDDTVDDQFELNHDDNGESVYVESQKQQEQGQHIKENLEIQDEAKKNNQVFSIERLRTLSSSSLSYSGAIEIINDDQIVLKEVKSLSKDTKSNSLLKDEGSVDENQISIKKGVRLPRDMRRRGPIPRYSDDDIYKNLEETQCEYCFIKFNTITELNDHENEHRQNEDRPYRCIKDDCLITFKDRYSLRNHIHIHSKQFKYHCRYCNRGFHQIGNLNAHQRLHTGEKPFKCKFCEYTFSDSSNLKSHERFHTGEKPYKCSLCKKYFRTHYSHVIHLRTHTKEKPYKCNECDKCFNSSSKLLIHQRIHTGERPYKCDQCESAFMDCSRLKRHLKIHVKD